MRLDTHNAFGSGGMPPERVGSCAHNAMTPTRRDIQAISSRCRARSAFRSLAFFVLSGGSMLRFHHWLSGRAQVTSSTSVSEHATVVWLTDTVHVGRASGA